MQRSATHVDAESGEVQSQHLIGSGVAGGPVTGGTLPWGQFSTHRAAATGTPMS